MTVDCVISWLYNSLELVLFQVLRYNVPHGKKNRGLFVVQAYKYLVKQPDEDNIYIARVLGWCIELVNFSPP